MDLRDVQNRRLQAELQRRRRARRARLLAAGSLLAVVVLAFAIVLSTTGGSGSRHAAKRPAPTVRRAPTPGTAAVPILTYHVINTAPPGSGASPDLYVSASEFSAQMDALKANGWRAVTLDQLQPYWTKGTPLPPGKPIVVAFDGGYASQYTNALPVLRRLAWTGVVNIASNGRSPADGGLTDVQTQGLIHAGWELDALGNDTPDLTALSTSQIVQELKSERQTLQTRYKVPVNWYSYPAGRYNGVVSAAVREAGFLGASTLASGWASPKGDRFRLPRIQVGGGTSPAALLSQISAAQKAAAPPAVSSGV